MRGLLWLAALAGSLLGASGPPGAAPGDSGVVQGRVMVSNTPAAGAVVYLESPTLAAATPRDTLVMDQISLRFVPRLLVVPPGTTVEFRNSDVVLHNIFGPGRPGPPFDLGTYASSATRYHSFNETGAHVVLCSIHPEMSAYVLVVPSEHFAVADESGRFRIEDVPPGSYRLGVWHRWTVPYEQEVDLADRLDLQIRLRSR